MIPGEKIPGKTESQGENEEDEPSYPGQLPWSAVPLVEEDREEVEEEKELDLMFKVEKQQSIVKESNTRFNTALSLKNGLNDKLLQELSVIQKENEKIHVERNAAVKSLQPKDLISLWRSCNSFGFFMEPL